MTTIDNLLRENLLPEHEPAADLNESVMQRAKEKDNMKRRTIKPGIAALAAALVILTGSVCAFAAMHFLSAPQVAQLLAENSALAESFESEDAVTLNETVNSGEYNVTLLGMVSGRNLTHVLGDEGDDRTYAAVAIAKADGSPMPSVSDDDYITFCISPLVEGKSFMELNNGIVNGGVQSFVQDGVQYQLFDCDSLKQFSGSKVWLGVVESFTDELKAFSMDETTGEYSLNSSYNGFAALFDIPLK